MPPRPALDMGHGTAAVPWTWAKRMLDMRLAHGGSITRRAWARAAARGGKGAVGGGAVCVCGRSRA
eukprot:1447893-Rhodomonas_salina.1